MTSSLSIQKFLITSLLITLAITILLTLVGDYYFLQQEMHVYAMTAVALLFPIAGGIASVIIQKSLRSLNKVAKEVASREANYLEPVSLSGVPEEVEPLVEEINLLLSRLKNGFEREKRFASDAAHELRTPLAGLKTQAQVALQAKDPETQKLALQNVIEGVNRSTHLVEQLLTLTRLLAQAETAFEISQIFVYRLIVDVLADMVPYALSKKIDIELLPEKEKIVLKANEKVLKALLVNLVDNAIRYMPEEGGTILVSVEQKDGKTSLTIRDSGPGIPPEYRDRVFEWFFRVSGNSYHGSGLGFAIIEQAVKLHHAEINIFTPSSGTGLEVNIVFPPEGKN
jgi:two-component system sensor histidine kinase QseC